MGAEALRMHEAAERSAAGEVDDAAGRTLDLGYFDRSHFTRDFTVQIDRSPGAYAGAWSAASGRALSLAAAESSLSAPAAASACRQLVKYSIRTIIPSRKVVTWW